MTQTKPTLWFQFSHAVFGALLLSLAIWWILESLSLLTLFQTQTQVIIWVMVAIMAFLYGAMDYIIPDQVRNLIYFSKNLSKSLGLKVIE